MALLAHLYSHIRGSQEDIATYSLQYILSESEELNRAFTQLLSMALNTDIDGQINYVCQLIGDNKERPDLAGINSNGHETVLCEAKFYAGLTDNQPNAYLERIAKEKGAGLVFICPSVRKQTLWTTLIKLIDDRNVQRIDDSCVAVDETSMAIITWNEIIEILRRCAAASAVSCLSDIDQLDGFCKQMDRTAFIPYTNEELGPEQARKEERPYRVIDALIDLLRSDISLNPSIKGTKATAYRDGYTRSINVRGYWLTINYDRSLWMNSSTTETPFWVAIRSGKDWKQTDSILEALHRFPEAGKESLWGFIFLALYAKQNATLDEVVQDLKRQLMVYIDAVDKQTTKID